jgi:hypothetical protein
MQIMLLNISERYVTAIQVSTNILLGMKLFLQE